MILYQKVCLAENENIQWYNNSLMCQARQNSERQFGMLTLSHLKG